MIKDILHHKVEDISIAAVPSRNHETNEEEWYVYLINRKNTAIENVLVSSKGYGIVDNKKVETSVLRHYIEIIPKMSFFKVEPIMPELFGISNQYWVSFYVGKQIYDKKYIFLAESIRAENYTTIPIMDVKGILLS